MDASPASNHTGSPDSFNGNGQGLHLLPGFAARVVPAAPLGLQTRLPPGEHAWRSRQLNDAGLNAGSIRALVGAGILHKARRGCYVRASYWNALDPADQARTLVFLHAHAAVASERAYSVYSHVSAARLHQLPLWNADSFIHVTRTAKNSTVQRASDVKVHCRPLPADQCTIVDGLLATTVLRTTVDCALTMSYKQALILMDHALHTGVPRSALEREARALDKHRGIRIFRAALAFATGDSESAGETLTRDLLSVCNIEPAQLQFKLTTRHGDYRADFAWPGYKVILEFDGEGKYFNYRPTQEVLRAERIRENELIELGWTVIRIGWKDLFNEHLFKSRLLSALRKGGMQ
ncbi:type IV toxin-antitoxin system AbiEi family antitoxin domain-containing protein [Arthrobacter sp. TMN-49]